MNLTICLMMHTLQVYLMQSVAAGGRSTAVSDMGAWFDVNAETSPKKEWAPVGVVCAEKEAGFASGKILCFPIPFD